MQSTPATATGQGRARLARILLLASLASAAMAAPAVAATGPTTRFDYVAVFPAGTDAGAIEGWRQAVLGRVHRHACLRDRPCVARMLRSVVPGRGDEVIAFDLMHEIADAERAAVLAAAVQVIPGTALRPASRLSDIGGGSRPQPAP